jgi:hypothetical protein
MGMGTDVWGELIGYVFLGFMATTVWTVWVSWLFWEIGKGVWREREK